MKKLLAIIVLVFLWCSTASAESTLPPCQDDIMRWTNCLGKKTYENGWSYVGEWKKGDWHGQGIVMYADGQVEKGRFRNGYLDNQKPETISLTGETVKTLIEQVDQEAIKKMKKKKADEAKKKQQEEQEERERILKDETKLKKSFYRDEIYVPMSAYRNELKLYAPLGRYKNYDKFKSEFESEVFKFCAYQNQNKIQFHQLNNMRVLYMMNSVTEKNCIYREASKLSEKYGFDKIGKFQDTLYLYLDIKLYEVAIYTRSTHGCDTKKKCERNIEDHINNAINVYKILFRDLDLIFK